MTVVSEQFSNALLKVSSDNEIFTDIVPTCFREGSKPLYVGRGQKHGRHGRSRGPATCVLLMGPNGRKASSHLTRTDERQVSYGTR